MGSAHAELTSPLAAIDIGSNTVHLVVASAFVTAHDVRPLADETALVRLGADVAATGHIGDERAALALTAIRQQIARARQLGAAVVLGIATEGVRAAANGEALLTRVRRETGVAFVLVSGEQEAALTYWGATSGQAIPGRQAVIDLGGGSLELVIGEGTHVLWRVSLALGSGLLHDRDAPADPPQDAQLEVVRVHVARALRDLEPPLPVAALAACGGTATALQRLAMHAFSAASASSPGNQQNAPELTEENFRELLDLLQRHPAEEVSAHFGVDVERTRLLGAGAVILREAMRRLGGERLRVSTRGIREGAVLAWARTGERWLDAAARGELL